MENTDAENENPEETEASEEGMRPKWKLNPQTPTPAEWSEHCKTHLPFRSWCPMCVQGRAKADPHNRVQQEFMGVPHVNLDYFFLGSRERGELVPCIVMKERYSKQLRSYIVPAKGKEGEVASRLASD